MAEDDKGNAEIISAVSNHDSSQDDRDINILKSADFVPDQNDSRVTDPKGAQSPASSTYADCEETDASNGGSQPELIPPSEKEVNCEPDTVDDENTESSSTLDIETEGSLRKARSADYEDGVTVQNGSGIKTKVTREIQEDENVEQEDEYDEIDLVGSEDDQYEDDSGDENGSHSDSNEQENDRENGDGEEVSEGNAAAQKKLDDDEDRRNPQYIPKRGFFYEHDDRTAGTESGDEASSSKKEAAEKEPEPKAKGRRAIPDGRWQHDMYKEDEQKAKSSQELIDIYGYDIRNEEAAPKARRRRKYGRGPNRYLRKWDDEDAYAKPASSRRSPRRQKLPVQREEYDNEFPALDQKSDRNARSRERRKTPPSRHAPNHEHLRSDNDSKYKEDRYRTPPRKSNRDHPRHVQNHEPPRSDNESKYKDDRHRTPPRKSNRDHPRHVQNHEPSRSDNESKYKDDRHRTPPRKPNSEHPDKTRNFMRRIPGTKDQTQNAEANEPVEVKVKRSPNFMRKQFVVTNTAVAPRGRGRGAVGHGKPPRYSNSSYDAELRPFQESRSMQFTSANRGRAKRLDRSVQYSNSGNPVTEDDMRELNEQLAATDLNKRSINLRLGKVDVERKITNEQPQPDLTSAAFASPTVRSKRYSHQRHRLLPESNMDKNPAAVAAPSTMNLHSIPTLQTVPHSMQNVMQQTGLCQTVTPTHTSMSLITQPPPQSAASPLSVNATTIPSSSMAVSASLIPLSAPPLTASAAALSATAPPLPIMGFFQHPQGFTGQGTAAQLYARDQTVIGGPGNQPVQLVAFLPATPMMSNANHAQTATPAPPPPPPSQTFPTTVMSYPQASQTQQTQPSFNSDSYSMPPVTLAPIHQPPEMYQSRGGVTYYNTRSQVKPRSPPPPRVKAAIPIVPPPGEATN